MVAWVAKFGLSQQSIYAFWAVAFIVMILVFNYGSKLVEKFAKIFVPGILLVLGFTYHEQLTEVVFPYVINMTKQQA